MRICIEVINEMAEVITEDKARIKTLEGRLAFISGYAEESAKP